MGVTASMSVSLIREDELAGLIACHHYSGPHQVSFIVRETAEFLGQALSWHVAAFEAREAAERAFQTQRSESAIVNALAIARSIPEGLCTTALMDLVGASGASLVYESRVHHLGTVPSSENARRIFKAIEPEPGAWVSATDKLSDRIADADAWDDVCAGAMALEISASSASTSVWYRPATDRTVDWAGDPRKFEVHDDAGAPRLSPRGSFALWRETVRGRSLPWEPWQIEAALNLRRVLVSGIRRRADELRVLNDQLARGGSDEGRVPGDGRPRAAHAAERDARLDPHPAAAGRDAREQSPGGRRSRAGRGRSTRSNATPAPSRS